MIAAPPRWAREAARGLGGPVAALAVLTALAVAARMLPLGAPFIAGVEWLRGVGVRGVLLLWAAHVLCTAASLPNSPFILATGYLYGPAWGLASALTSNTLAALFALGLGRRLRPRIAPWILRRPLFAAVEEAVMEEPTTILVLLRLSPLMPFALLNYTLSLTRVSLRTYALTAVIGSVPGALLFVYVGSLADRAARLLDRSASGSAAALTLYGCGLAATVVASAWVGWLARRALSRRLRADAPGQV